MAECNARFNVAEEPWIIVDYADGSQGMVSLKDLFTVAPSIRRIGGELPHMQFAILRLALAIMYRAYGDPRFESTSEEELRTAWDELWRAENFEDGVIAEYLSYWRDRFELFGARPFFQVPELSYAKEQPAGIDVLMPDVPKADKTLFSMRCLRHNGRLSFDEAARYLVVAQAFDVAGIKTPVVGNTHVNKGKVYAPKGMSGTGWCGALGGVFLEGGNLFETLLLNWVLVEQGPHHRHLLGIQGDVPCWELEDATADLRIGDPRGPAQLLAWQSRRVRLVPDDSASVQGVVLCYGDIASPVDKDDLEMMTAWRESPAQQKKLGLPYVPLMPRKHEPSRAIWRGLGALLAQGGAAEGSPDVRPGVIRWAESIERAPGSALDAGYPMAIRIQGMEYGTQDSVFSDGVDDAISIRALLLDSDGEATREVLEVVGQTERAVSHLVQFVLDVCSARGDRRRMRPFDVEGVPRDVREHAYDELDALFRRRISEMGPMDDAIAYCDAWRAEVRSTLLDAAARYVESTGASYFDRQDSWTAGEALRVFRVRLATTLGSQPGAAFAPGATGRCDAERG